MAAPRPRRHRRHPRRPGRPRCRRADRRVDRPQLLPRGRGRRNRHRRNPAAGQGLRDQHVRRERQDRADRRHAGADRRLRRGHRPAVAAGPPDWCRRDRPVRRRGCAGGVHPTDRRHPRHPAVDSWCSGRDRGAAGDVRPATAARRHRRRRSGQHGQGTAAGRAAGRPAAEPRGPRPQGRVDGPPRLLHRRRHRGGGCSSHRRCRNAAPAPIRRQRRPRRPGHPAAVRPRARTPGRRQPGRGCPRADPAVHRQRRLLPGRHQHHRSADLAGGLVTADPRPGSERAHVHVGRPDGPRRRHRTRHHDDLRLQHRGRQPGRRCTLDRRTAAQPARGGRRRRRGRSGPHDGSGRFHDRYADRGLPAHRERHARLRDEWRTAAAGARVPRANAGAGAVRLCVGHQVDRRHGADDVRCSRLVLDPARLGRDRPDQARLADRHPGIGRSGRR